jgi:hypothetical protein
MNNILPATAVPFPNAYFVEVTPELAKSWLDTNPVNRPVLEQQVQKFASRMTAGQWRMNYCGIAFAEDGTLVNGLHRLHAVVRSGKTVPMTVIVNEPLEDSHTTEPDEYC